MNRLLLTVLVIGAVLGGGVYYVLTTRAPGRNYDAAKAEIERWEERANKLRTCLLGTTPASPIAAEALAIRELTNNSPEFKKCTASISELSRGDAPDTGIKDVEDEWKSLTKAITGLASSFARVLVTGGNKQGAIDELGDALDTLDVANSNLRQAAQMDPEPSGKAKPSLAKAELIMLGTSKRAKLSAWLRPSAGGMVALVEPSPDNGVRGRLAGEPTGASRSRPQQQLVLVPGQLPKRTPFQPGVRPSVTNVKWGMKAVKGKLEIGTLTITGELEVKVDASISDPPIADSQVLFALGEMTNGAIAYVVEPTGKTPVVSVGRTGLGGNGEAVLPDHPWFDGGSPEEADLYSFAVSPPERGMLTWSHRGKLRGIIARPGTDVSAPLAAVALGAGDVGQSCLTAKYGWIASGDQLVAFDGATAFRVEMPDHEMIGCDASSVLLRQSGHRYAVCGMTVPTQGLGSGAPPPPSPSCRTVDLPAGIDAIPGLSGGRVVAVASRQRVLAVWREQADVAYFVMPETFKPRVLQATNKLLDVLGETDEGLAVVRVVR